MAARGRPFSTTRLQLFRVRFLSSLFSLWKASRNEASRFLTDPLVNANRLSLCLARDCRGTKAGVRLLQVPQCLMLSFKGRTSHTSE